MHEVHDTQGWSDPYIPCMTVYEFNFSAKINAYAPHTCGFCQLR